MTFKLPDRRGIPPLSGSMFLRSRCLKSSIIRVIAFGARTDSHRTDQMLVLKGNTVSGGGAVGRIAVVRNEFEEIAKVRVRDPRKEIRRLKSAVQETGTQLQKLREKAAAEADEASAAVFEAHMILLEDQVFLEAIRSKIRSEQVNAEYAVFEVGEKFARMLSDAEDEYMKVRAADVKDVCSQLRDALCGAASGPIFPPEPSIVIANDLSPSQAVHMDRSRVLAFATVKGSATSHTSILARVMNIPALTGIDADLTGLEDGMRAAVDGWTGELILEPDEEKLLELAGKIREKKEEEELLLALKGKESVTKSGRKIGLYANVNSIEDIRNAVNNDAEGIGLFRSEFLYMERNQLPDEEEQLKAYRRALLMADGRNVVIRTLDIGAEKNVQYLGISPEENPVMGFRGIRFSLMHRDIFKTQLRALLRAAAEGPLGIMYPLIISADEVLEIRKIVNEAAAELEKEGKAYRIPRQGIMIETPAAVMISEELAELVDFLSIGTNDLTQYTLAIDRQNNALGTFYDPHHPAIMRMIRMVAESAHKKGKIVAICGELGGEINLTEEFVRMGIDGLSVSPYQVLRIRKKIREIV